MIKIYVLAKCISCGNKKKIFPGEVASGDMPICDKCFGIMIADSAVKK